MSENMEKATDSEEELITEEIVEDKKLEYIPFTSNDAVFRQKKWFFILAVLLCNFGCIFLVIFTPGSAYIMIPFVTLSHVRDFIFVIVAIVARIFRIQKRNWGKKIELRKGYSIKMASIVTCYSEKFETVLETCESLFRSAEKTKETLDITVQNIIVCVCDGRLIGEENTEPLSDSFRKIMTQTQKPIFRKYITWKNNEAVAMVNIGYLKDAKRIFILITKSTNHGKKDGLILAKKIINEINTCPRGKEAYSINPLLKVTNPNSEEGDGCLIKYTFCTDADTAIDINCVPKCIKTMEQYPEVDGAVSLLRVLFHKRSWFWDPMQHFQYFNSQFIRRGAESFFGKVTCLSGSGNICRVSSPAYKYANYHYEKYPKTTSLLDVVTKLNGTDRRYTTLMLKYSRQTKIVMLEKSFTYTETPQSTLTFISQRKRWGSNSMSNSLVNIASRNFPWYTKLSAMVDVFRILSSYFRIMSYVWFWVYIYQVQLAAVIFVLVTICVVYSYALLIILIYGDKRLVLLYGFLLNKLTSPILTCLIFSEILFRFDDFSWGMTQKVKEGQEIDMSSLFGKDVNVKFGKKNRKTITFENNVDDNYLDDESDTSLKEIVIEGGNNVNKLKSIGKPYKNLQKSKKLKWTSRKEDFDDREDLKVVVKERIDRNSMIELSLTDISGSDSEIGWDVNSKFEGNDIESNVDENGIPVPPPPPGDGIPPPPPPPGMGMPIGDKSKTKRLHWKGINKLKAKSTFWENSGYVRFSLNEQEMMELFEETINAINPAAKKNERIVDFHKMHLTGVILKKFKWKISEIVGQIMDCVIDNDGIAALMTLFPLTDDETKNIKEYLEKKPAGKTEKDLSIPEQFFVSVYKLNIVNVRQRLECCAFRNNVTPLLSDIRNYVTTINKACSALKRSTKFASILRVIYKAGSVLNKGTYLESAAGFKLDILSNIKDTKTKTGDNLLHYLVKNIAQKKPKLLTFAKEIKYVVPASKISIGSINQLFEFVENNVKTLQSELERTKISKENNKADALFYDTFNEFYEVAEQQVEIERRLLKQSLALFKDTNRYFGEEDEKTTEEFFGSIATFINDFNIASERYVKHFNQLNGDSTNVKEETGIAVIDGDVEDKVVSDIRDVHVSNTNNVSDVVIHIPEEIDHEFVFNTKSQADTVNNTASDVVDDVIVPDHLVGDAVDVVVEEVSDDVEVIGGHDKKSIPKRKKKKVKRKFDGKNDKKTKSQNKIL